MSRVPPALASSFFTTVTPGNPLLSSLSVFFLFPAKIFHCCFVHWEVKDVLIFPIFDGTTDTHDSLFPPSLVISSIFTTFFCSHLFALRLPVTNSKMCFI